MVRGVRVEPVRERDLANLSAAELEPEQLHVRAPTRGREGGVGRGPGGLLWLWLWLLVGLGARVGGPRKLRVGVGEWGNVCIRVCLCVVGCE